MLSATTRCSRSLPRRRIPLASHPPRYQLSCSWQRRCASTTPKVEEAAASTSASPDAKGKGKAPDTPATEQEPETKKKADDALPFLQRPLGVREPPSTLARSWEQRRADLLDQDKRLAKRQHLIKQVGTGYWSDLNATRRHGGKTWIAPRVLIREDKALYFPDIAGTALDSGQKVHTTALLTGKISVVAMLNTRMSEIHASAFADPSNALFLSHPSYQYVQINLQENLLKSLLVSLFLSSIRKTVPAHLHAGYMVSSQNMEYLRDEMGMVNKHIGYVYLVDDKCRIRWAACGDAKEEETQGLVGCARALLTRMDREKAERAEKKKAEAQKGP
ncbi:hypothetical protein PUNSTDRAFT_87856 [Punctularia strigosozonata HHB-11173 SS5]|uniref:uncharacterized protein n=1 Tax=Punctularia strigosozonata (strain HHB-11173) TaxID=741275 RepID=UPI000441645A|nr:uncharacterized protein PUNSTDRAFT_87856 [Punctularia strigosozonata HHB-11173 SS5]EIN08441.1 hypothetical protein PUNSTDRAFT_87856 [Punctularia strigosozonata HHB-11173 SS5]